ncbi:MAG: histidinol-phosphate transaminase [Bacteroidota bacterium]
MDFDIQKLIRPHLKSLTPYASARSEFSGTAKVWLDANENAYGTPSSDTTQSYHRYPDPYQKKLKARIGELKGLSTDQIFLGNGSDEAIDLLIRVFCQPGIDNVVTLPPTFGMYEVAASVNDVAVHSAPLLPDYQLDREAVASATDNHTKIIFFCSPNNPTGNLLNPDEIRTFLDSFQGIVVVDEAYIDFSDQPSFIAELKSHPNLVVLHTFSKAWGMASLRLGAAFASTEIINLLNRVKLPYNISTLNQEVALNILLNTGQYQISINQIIRQREWLANALNSLEAVHKVHHSDANFLLVKFEDAPALYQFLVKAGVIVRNRSTVRLCEGGLRITVGTESENQALVKAIRQFENQYLKKSRIA